MELKELNIRTNIRVLAWIYAIMFGGLGLISLSNVVLTLIYNENPMNQEWLEADPTSFGEATSIATGIFAASAFSLSISIIVIVTAIELMKFRKWAALTINIVSVIIVIVIISIIVFGAFQFQTSDINYNVEHFGSENTRYWELVKKYQLISYGTIGLIICWGLTKANLLFLKKEYKAVLR